MFTYSSNHTEIKFVICNVCALLIHTLHNDSNNYHDFTVEFNMGGILRYLL